MKTIQDVCIGDCVVCYDEYSHDYIEHKLVINIIENDDEDGVVLYGTDLSFPEDEYDNYITRVYKGNFICVCDKGE